MKKWRNTNNAYQVSCADCSFAVVITGGTKKSQKSDAGKEARLHERETGHKGGTYIQRVMA